MSKRLSIIVWNDAHASGLEEMTEAEIIAAHHPNLINTYGYVVHQNDLGYSIAAEWLPSDGSGEETYRGVTFVPRAIVAEIRPLPSPRRRAVHKKEEEVKK